MEDLLKFISDHADADLSKLILNRNKFPKIDMELAVNSIESRRKLKGKVPEWHSNPRLLFPFKLSAEQCSSSSTGRYKAELADNIVMNSNPGKSRWTLADLTGGLGVDSWFFSQKAGKVIYNEMQEVLCQAAKHNFSVLGAGNVEIHNLTIDSDTCSQLLGQADCPIDIIYIDPARRGEGGKKVFLIEDCTPDVLTLKDLLFRHTEHILIKLSPMADISMVCNRLGQNCREVHVVSVGGECKELLIWLDRNWTDEYRITATELSSESAFSFSPSEEKESVCQIQEGNISGFLFEPGKSLMKAGAFNLISSRFDISKLAHSTHYYTTLSQEKAIELKKYGKVFSIETCMPLDKRSFKDIGKTYPKADVTARNIPIDTDTLRKRLGVVSGESTHIFGLKSETHGNILLVGTRL